MTAEEASTAPRTWQRVEVLFNGAVEVPEPERERWLDEKCAGDEALKREVLSLLASDSAARTGFVAQRVAGAAQRLLRDEAESPNRPHAGPYRLLREIGQGGMGTVYLAERDDGEFRKTVAVKLVRPGMDTDFILARFRRERQTLARLDHPNIGRLLDGGTTEDGIPYLVMEYIDGHTITRHCEYEGLSVHERLRLFLEVCSAVHHAHSNLVVHRDLKPGNILVGADGRPKLLDFGICKLLYRDPGDASRISAIGFRAMTPAYASPEQLSGSPVTVASDVYSLGAVLYELLSGQRPHLFERGKATPQQIAAVVCNSDVLPPSAAVQRGGRPEAAALARALAGDLDSIVLKAMEREPTRRYQSADQLAADLRRHLDGLPVSTRAHDRAYRARKFVRRHRLGLGVAFAVAAGLGLGLGLTLARVPSGRPAGDPGSPALELELSSTYLRLGDLESQSSPESAATAQTSYWKAIQLADGLVSQGKDVEKALLVRMQAHEHLADAFRRHGEARRAADLYQQALDDCREALRRQPSAVSLVEAQGRLAAALSRVTDAPEIPGKQSQP